MFSRPKILFLVSLLFVALLNSIPTYLLNFLMFYHSSLFALIIIFQQVHKMLHGVYVIITLVYRRLLTTHLRGKAAV